MKTTLAGVMIVILTLIINFSTIHTNRLKSDSTHFKSNVENLESNTERTGLHSQAQEDHFKDEYGYTSDSGKYNIPNKKEEYTMGFEFDLIPTLLKTYDNLFLATNENSNYYGELPNSSWRKDNTIIRWNEINNEVTIDPIDDGNKYTYKSYPFDISQDYTGSYDDIYKLDYYKDIETGDILYEDGLPHIILKLKNNSVVNYTIVNPVVKDYDIATVYDVSGNEVFHLYKDYVEKGIIVPRGDEDFEVIEATGHLMRISNPQMISMSLSFHNPLLTSVTIGNHKELIYGIEGMDITESREYLKDLTYNLYGEDFVEIIIYEEGDENSRLYRIEDFYIALEYIIKE